jgi:hypothetical protein
MRYVSSVSPRGNRSWSDTSQNEADARCAALDEAGCTDCRDCAGCVNCIGCIGCFGCTDCLDCADCTDCTNCTSCTDCAGCANCYRLRGMSYYKLPVTA